MTDPAAPRPIDRRFRLAHPLALALVAAAAALAAFHPALSSQFIGDDWGFLALARHLTRPWDFYFYDHSSSYFYRPNAMVAWWLSTWLLGLNPAAHMMLNCAIHALNAALLGAIIGRATGRHGIALAGAALFALHPAAIGTSLWLADRFDLLATAAVLWALLALERAIEPTSGTGRGRRAIVFVAAALAAGCKETAIVLPMIALARLALPSPRSWRWRIATWAGIFAPFALMLVARAMLLAGVETTLAIRDLVGSAAQGIGFWLARLPAALAGTGSQPLTAVLALALLLLAGAAWRGRGRAGAPAALPALVVAAGLALAPALVQWPVTQGALGTPESLDNPVNLRFYYLALGGVMLALAILFRAVESRAARGALCFAALVAAAAWLPASYQRAAAWSARTNTDEHQLNAAAVAALEHLAPAPFCRVHLAVTESTYSTFGGFVDVAVKAQLPRKHPLLRCAVLLDSRVPWFSLTRERPCADAPWAPLAPRTLPSGGALGARRIGNLCYHYFDQPGPAFPGVAGVDYWFAWDGRAFQPRDAGPAAGG